MTKLRAVLGIADFFVPADVLSSVLLVFTMENILDQLFSTYVPAGLQTEAWVAIYLIGALVVSGFNYATAGEEELEELSDDFDDL
jgi:hypothetical protein